MITPLLHRIIVKADKIDETDPEYKRLKALGLELADHSDRKREQVGVDKGIVVSVGPRAFKDFGEDTPPIATGDYVAYAKFAGKKITDPYTLEEVIALNDEDVICVFKE